MRREAGHIKKIITVLFSAALIFVMFINSPRYGRAQAVQVKLICPEVSDIYDVCTLRGTIAERGRENLYAEAVSTVEKVYVSIGERVSAGQPLMRLRSSEGVEELSRAVFADMERRISELLDSGGETEEAEEYREALMSVMAEAVDIYERDEPEMCAEYTLCSPTDGIVMSVAEEGGKVSPLLPCAAVSDMSRLILTADASEEDAVNIKEGMSCTVSVSAFNASFAGKVRTVMPYARKSGLFTTSPEIKTRVLIDIYSAEETEIRPGYSAQAKLTTNHRGSCLLIPYEAVGQDERGEYVMKISGGRTQKAYVETGAELDEQVQICAGVAAEDILVANAGELQEGQRISVK